MDTLCCGAVLRNSLKLLLHAVLHRLPFSAVHDMLSCYRPCIRLP